MAEQTRIRAAMFGMVALVAGGIALGGLYQVFDFYQTEIEKASKPEDSVYVMVASEDLLPGIPISADDLYAIELPPRMLPDGVYITPDQVVGRIPRERILAHELVRSPRLADLDVGKGLNAVIPEGTRALSLDIDNAKALSGLLRPGSYVDVIVTIEPEDGPVETQTVMQSVFVIGVDSKMGEEVAEEARRLRGRHKPSVTVLVPESEQATLAHARQRGDITLVLRNRTDEVIHELAGVRRLIEQEQKRVVIPRAVTVVEERDATQVRICRGVQCETEEFDN